MQTVDVRRLAELQRDGEVDVVDVRTPAEYRELHMVGAKNVPLDSLEPEQVVASRNGRSEEPLYVICQSGARSSKAVKKFMDAGVENVVNVEGGTQAWDRAGLPVLRGKKTLPLPQQMQLTAGLLITLGVALGYSVSPLWFGLSGFVGLGLIFAGTTGVCPMSSLIAKMPWNQCEDGSSCCAS